MLGHVLTEQLSGLDPVFGPFGLLLGLTIRPSRLVESVATLFASPCAGGRWVKQRILSKPFAGGRQAQGRQGGSPSNRVGNKLSMLRLVPKLRNVGSLILNSGLSISQAKHP